jgi:hypothetical protein
MTRIRSIQSNPINQSINYRWFSPVHTLIQRPLRAAKAMATLSFLQHPHAPPNYKREGIQVAKASSLHSPWIRSSSSPQQEARSTAGAPPPPSSLHYHRRRHSNQSLTSEGRWTLLDNSPRGRVGLRPRPRPLKQRKPSQINCG